MRVALIGTGFGAKVHLPGWRRVPGVEVTAICSARRARAEALGADHGIPVAVADYRELLARDDVDLVDVATHADTHREIALAALAAGKHVLCEKPLAATLAHAREMADAATAAGVVAAVGFQHRYLPERQRMRDLVREGFVGAPRLVTVSVHSGRALDPSSPLGWWGPYGLREHGGGVLNQVLAHYVDFIRFLFGDLRDAAGTAATTVREKPVARDDVRTGGPPAEAGPDGTRAVDADDAVVMHGRLPGGAPAVLSASWVLHHGTGARVEVHGSEGTLVLEADRCIRGARAGERLGEQHAAGPVPPDLVPPFARLGAELASAVAGDASPAGGWSHPTFADGVRVQEIVDAVLAG